MQYAVITHQGSRTINEDAVGCFKNQENYCFIVCDGLGGHGMGDTASALVTKTFEEQFAKATELSSFLKETFFLAQEQLLEKQQQCFAKNKMKTTAVALVTNQTQAYVAHVGDSRLYWFGKRKIKFRTKDHSVPQALVLSGEIKEEEIRNHPDRNKLLRVMGTPWQAQTVSVEPPISLKQCNAFLLCSDGFWELIEEKEMCKLLRKSHSPEEWLQKMEEIVKEKGKDKNMDNYSAIAVWNKK